MAPFHHLFLDLLAGFAAVNPVGHDRPTAESAELAPASPTSSIPAPVPPPVPGHIVAAGYGSALTEPGPPAPKPKPFYAIAHRVLMSKHVADALDNGANALEIDMTAWRKGWWADHDGIPTSWGSTAEAMFRTIADARRAGRNIIFVWLDIKNPNGFGPDNPAACIEALRDLARLHLEPAGVRVLYGFYHKPDVSSRAYDVIYRGLNANEAMAVDGPARFADRVFHAHGPANVSQRVMSNGYFNPGLNFGNCRGAGAQICPQLRIAAESGSFGKVFGWTVANHNAKQAVPMMADAHVDGLIYGFVQTHYYDDPATRGAFRIISAWLDQHADQRYLATVDDSPW